MRERKLGRGRQLVRREPAKLDEVVAGSSLTVRSGCPGETEDDAPVVRLEPEAEKVERLELKCRLLAHFSPQRVERQLVLVEEAAGQIPQTLPRIEGAPPEQDSSLLVATHGFGAGHRIRVADVAAGLAVDAVFELVDSLAADGTEAPSVECAHEEETMHDQPEPTEAEQEQAPQRLEEEEAQRGTWEDNPQQAEEERNE